jgi:hypothetical protein
VNTHGNEVERPQFINLDALGMHVDDFVVSIDSYLVYIEEVEQAEQEYKEEMMGEAE